MSKLKKIANGIETTATVFGIIITAIVGIFVGAILGVVLAINIGNGLSLPPEAMDWAIIAPTTLVTAMIFIRFRGFLFGVFDAFIN